MMCLRRRRAGYCLILEILTGAALRIFVWILSSLEPVTAYTHFAHILHLHTYTHFTLTHMPLYTHFTYLHTLYTYTLTLILADIELCPGGKSTALTIGNVEEYLCAVVSYTLKEVIRLVVGQVKPCTMLTAFG